MLYPLIQAVLLCVLFAVALDLVVDRHLVMPVLRWVYRLGAKNDPPKGSFFAAGIVHGRKTASLVSIIIVISLCIQAYRLTHYQVDLLVEFCMLVLDVPSIFVGVVFVAPAIHNLFVKNKDPVYRSIDMLREGEIDVGKLTNEAKAKAEGIAGDMVEGAARMGSSAFGRVVGVFKRKPVAPVVPAPQAPPMDYEAVLKQYGGGKR